ncbi:monovalent cation/H+ antiporter complex subunit F [Corynebacterium breve]|uniref:Monovalent cation/H+ antiporter complex subunit F n=1 Tax=Corynebacterium breve TaxID=3049799 RepID=A0ABY8VCJ9_9CORY|nr:monovalent cation/H+ antiporter complex subunit F [Corynebacterium breve]WIM67395.1 monovalent cation/H+ antiporter complex subunit F [Corynebacterium breve]
MDPTLYNAFLLVAALLLTAGFLIMTWRIIIGPDSLDRILGMDGITAMLQCALATYICWTLDTTVVNVMIVIALLGFISTLSVARFRKRDGS